MIFECVQYQLCVFTETEKRSNANIALLARDRPPVQSNLFNLMLCFYLFLSLHNHSVCGYKIAIHSPLWNPNRFFSGCYILKKNRRGCGDFSCDEFPKLSKYVIKLPFHFPFAAKGTVLSCAGRRCSARRRASQAASLTKQQHNMLYVKKERAEWDRQTLSHDLEGGATICLSNPESFPYFYCSTRFNIMTWPSKRTSHLTFKNIPWSKYLDIIREFSGMHKIQERVAREGQMSDREACEVRRHRGRQMCDPIPARRCCWERESRRPLFPMSKNWGGNCS